jgi:hypothetical protein
MKSKQSDGSQELIDDKVTRIEGRRGSVMRLRNEEDAMICSHVEEGKHRKWTELM